MAYTVSRMISDAGIDGVDARARKSLAERGFGVLTEADLHSTMKKKHDVETYRILVDCNPKMAHKAIENSELTAVAGEVRDLLTKTVGAI